MKNVTLSNETLTTILGRKSVRTFTGKKIRKELIGVILHAAMAAPAALHKMPWKFIVITDAEKLRSLEAGLPFAKMLSGAGTAIVVCAVSEEAALGNELLAILDCSCASENILLAAESLGLGAVWTAVYPNQELISFVRKELNIPDNVIPLNIIPIGYPAGNEKAQDKYSEANVHLEHW